MRTLRTTMTLVLLLTATQGLTAQDGSDPRESGIVEKTGVELVLIDVDATDRDGNPMRDLTRADFQILLNGRDIPIETLDNLCACSRPVELRRRSWQPRNPAFARHFVLYFDFSQMDEIARKDAVKEARRWLRNMPQQTTRVMVAAFSSGTGVERLTRFVEPLEAIGAVAEIGKAKRFKDTWPQERMLALSDCKDRSFDGSLVRPDDVTGGDLEKCMDHARLDLSHSRRSLKALLFFLTTIESERPSKTMLLFSQTLNVDPGKIFGPSRLERLLADPTPLPGAERQMVKNFDFRAGDTRSLLSEVAGTAFVSRTTIYPIHVGAGETWAVNFAANLADPTGGQYNRGMSDLRDTMKHAVDRCPCTYRIGIRPSRIGAHLRSRLKVMIRGEQLLALNDIRLPDSVDRWARRAQAVLSNPESSYDLPLNASLLPELNEDGRWGMTALVSFDARALEMLPEGDRVKGEWEVGALVFKRPDGRSWEMLGVSEVTSKVEPGDEAFIVHEHAFPEVSPGEYEIRAFIRDKWANVFGGDRGTLELPRRRIGATVGPLTMVGETDQVRTTLPLRKKKIQRDHESTARNTKASVPAGDAVLEPGVLLEVASWACGNKDTPPTVHDASIIGDQRSVKLDPPEVQLVGHCARATSVIDTARLARGPYEYVIRWALGTEESTNGSVPFRLGPDETEPPVTPPGQEEDPAGTDTGSW